MGGALRVNAFFNIFIDNFKSANLFLTRRFCKFFLNAEMVQLPGAIFLMEPSSMSNLCKESSKVNIGTKFFSNRASNI